MNQPLSQTQEHLKHILTEVRTGNVTPPPGMKQDKDDLLLLEEMMISCFRHPLDHKFKLSEEEISEVLEDLKGK